MLFIAKKIIETVSSSKLSNVEVSKENVSQPKRAKRKLYTNEISSPIDISGQVVSCFFTFLKHKSVRVILSSDTHNNLNFIIV